MTKRPSFDKNYLKKEFDKLNAQTKQPLTLFLIGGGAMAFYGLKAATKDIDIILTTKDDSNKLKSALEALGYQEPNSIHITRAYSKMQTSAMIENQDGFRWDLFITKVCNALTLSATMKQRATPLYKGDQLTVLIASKEDVFLFKGITEREADLDDMRMLAESGLKWDIVNQECQSQSTTSGVSWEAALYQNLLDLKTKYSIESPIEKALRNAAERKLIKTTLLREIEKGNNTVKTIAQTINEPPLFVRAELKKLANKGLITIDKTHKPHKFYINKNPPQRISE